MPIICKYIVVNIAYVDNLVDLEDYIICICLSSVKLFVGDITHDAYD